MYVQNNFVDNYLHEHGSEYDGGVIQAVQGADYGGRFEAGLMRPMLADNWRDKFVVVNAGRRLNPQTGKYEPVYREVAINHLRNQGVDQPIWNATTTLRKDEWIRFDEVVVKETRLVLRAWEDLAMRSPYPVPGMEATIIEHEAANDPGFARVDMDGLSDSPDDNTTYQLRGTPLAITHSDFHVDLRTLNVSRRMGRPLDTTRVEAATRRVAETVEATTIGTVAGITYGTNSAYDLAAKVFGYTNYTNRNTYTSVTTPTGSNPSATVDNVLAMRQLLYNDGFNGPFMLYHSKDWDTYMDDDYYTLVTQGATSPTKTLRERLRGIADIEDVKRLPYWTPASAFQLLLVQMTQDVARAIIGLRPTTVRWETVGGLRLNFKVMAILVPEMRSTISGNCGIVHGTTS